VRERSDLQEREKAALQAPPTARKDEFLAMLSHELRNRSPRSRRRRTW
jgi:signal transduction histidine kinase